MRINPSLSLKTIFSIEGKALLITQRFESSAENISVILSKRNEPKGASLLREALFLSELFDDIKQFKIELQSVSEEVENSSSTLRSVFDQDINEVILRIHFLATHTTQKLQKYSARDEDDQECFRRAEIALDELKLF